MPLKKKQKKTFEKKIFKMHTVMQPASQLLNKKYFMIETLGKYVCMCGCNEIEIENIFAKKKWKEFIIELKFLNCLL